MRILSLDGGGIRGIVSLAILEALSKQTTDSRWLDTVNLFAGNSTGGLIALGLANNVSIEDLKALYIIHGASIFRSRWPGMLKLIANAFRARYRLDPLEQHVRDVLKDATLGDLPRKVMIASFDVIGREKDLGAAQHQQRWRAKFFHNFDGLGNSSESGPQCDWNQPAWKVALYTASAPVFFPIIDGYVDGGVAANNPSMAALALTQDPRYFSARESSLDRQAPAARRIAGEFPTFIAARRAPAIPSEVRLLSIGTGQSHDKIAAPRNGRKSWGFLSWINPFGKPGTPLLSVMMEGDTNVPHFQCAAILGNNQRRIQINFDSGRTFDMDEPSQIPELLAYLDTPAVKEQIAEVALWLDTVWRT